MVIANHDLAQDISRVYRMQELVFQRLTELNENIKPLSEREQSVLDRVLSGRLNKSIAKELEISERAVERIRSRIMKKYGAETTAQLVSMATEQKVLAELTEAMSSPPMMTTYGDSDQNPGQFR